MVFAKPLVHQMPWGEVKVLIELRFPMMFIRFSYCSPALWVGITKLDSECFSMFTPTWWGGLVQVEYMFLTCFNELQDTNLVIFHNKPMDPDGIFL